MCAAAAVWMRGQDPEESERPKPRPGTCGRRRAGRGHSRPTAGPSSGTIHSPPPEVLGRRRGFSSPGPILPGRLPPWTVRTPPRVGHPMATGFR
ncbi:unnamed protein product [Rangifer tarandus platyrhynchus]|uniref:Uncharacterized protein n=1 Tax=Rangifer tarandus platyrhynchus TaxID=3082113 RepID=A0AC60A5L9_RANTA